MPTAVFTAAFEPVKKQLEKTARTCRIVCKIKPSAGAGNPGQFPPTSWWSGGDSNL
jgi:hypothetical protein